MSPSGTTPLLRRPWSQRDRAVTDDATVSAAKVGILAGSLLAATLGVVTILIAHRRTLAARRRAHPEASAAPVPVGGSRQP